MRFLPFRIFSQGFLSDQKPCGRWICLFIVFLCFTTPVLLPAQENSRPTDFALSAKDSLSVNFSAQQKVKISGFILDKSSRPIELVNVIEMHSRSGTSSHEDGYYELDIPWRDTVILHFSCLSYQTAVRIVPVETNRIQINLNMSTSTKALQEVVVQGQSRQVNSLQRINTSDIHLLPDPTGGSIEALLVTFAGVSSNNELSSQYSVRGGNYDENLVYVNGMEIYRPLLIRSGQQEGLSFVNPQMTESVLFSAGGFDARYGDKMSSVLDIQYKTPEQFEASAHLGLLGANAFVGNRSENGKFTQIHGIRYKTNAYLLNSLETKGEYQPNFLDYQTYLTYRLHSKWSLSFLGNFSQNTYRFTPESRQTETGTFNSKYSFKVYFDGMEKDVFKTAFAALGLKYQANKNLSIQIQSSAFNTKEEENYDITGQYWLSETPIKNNQADTANTHLIGVGTYHDHARNDLNATVFNLSQSGQWTFNRNTLKWGLAYQRERISDRIREWEIQDSSGYALPYSNQHISFRSNLRSESDMESHRFTAYLQETWKTRIKAGMLTLTGGVRSNYWSFNNEWIISPRFSIGFIPAWERDFTFRLAGGVYYQAPFYKELRDTLTQNKVCKVVLNKDIKAQKSIQIVGGMDYHFIAWDRPFKLSAEVYYKHLDNLIPYTVDNVRIRYYGRNMASGYATGADIKLFGEFVPGTDSWITLSLMDSKESIGNYTVPRPNEQRYNISMFFRDYLPNNPKYSMTLKLVWGDGLCFGPPSMDRSYATTRMKPYRRADIGFSRRIVGGEDRLLRGKALRDIKNIWIGLDCFNLFGINNTNSYYWVKDVYNREWAIPNYLTGRQLNLSLSIEL